MIAAQVRYRSASPARRSPRVLVLCLICTLLLGPWAGLLAGAAEPSQAVEAVAAMPCHGAPEAPPAAAGDDCCDGLCWHCALCGPAPALPLNLWWRAAAAHNPSVFPSGIAHIARGHPDHPYRPPSSVCA